jgi:uncharacterized protein YneF (UPF0154 family)
MSSTMKLLTRTLIILILMIIGSWLSSRLTLPAIFQAYRVMRYIC